MVTERELEAARRLGLDQTGLNAENEHLKALIQRARDLFLRIASLKNVSAAITKELGWAEIDRWFKDSK